MQQRIASRLRNVRAGVSDEGRKSDMNGGAYSSGRIGGKIAFAKYLVADLSTAVQSAEEQKNVSKERWNEKLETYQKKEKIVTKIARDIKNAKSALEKAEGKYYKCETERKRVEEQNRQDEEEDDDEEGKSIKRRSEQMLAVIIVRVIFISWFLFYCLLLNHSFQTNPNRID